MADSYILVERFNGISTIVAGEVSIGKNDVDIIKYTNGLANMAEGTILSVPRRAAVITRTFQDSTLLQS